MIDNRADSNVKTVLYTLQLPSTLESLTSVENFVDKIKDEYDVQEDTYANILTCLSEATINAILHGNKEDKSKKVFINLEVVENRKLIFTISDEGEGFDYSLLPDPTAPENLENLSGRGVFIIKHLADQCIFNTQGNEIELHFKI
ncbi:ATP-binding protein [Pedobacter sp. HMF7647]|uniref:ATP-binding protein n=1 Tax=Hufsiella arboris TaxID=2695275 RepID=A0A7K1Y6V0_9SPHI|nr:ATP-binding protein [Hufsiella arboris]MXV49778.1 ATP-binding protein [Hufsiella arboris]